MNTTLPANRTGQYLTGGKRIRRSTAPNGYAPVASGTVLTVLGPGGSIGRGFRPQQLDLAEFVAGCIRDNEHGLGEAGTGCIQGDAEIIVNRGGNARRMRLADVVVRFNGGRTPGQQKRWDLSIPTYVQREQDGVVRLARLVNAWESGIKQ